VLPTKALVPSGSADVREVDRFGNSQSHKTQYVVRKEMIYETTLFGYIKYNRPSYTIEKGGRVVATAPFALRCFEARDGVAAGRPTRSVSAGISAEFVQISDDAGRS
jgi:hypothetical protein